MATTTAAARTGLSAPQRSARGRAKFFLDFLDAAPEFITRKYLEERLLGKAPGFEVKKGLDNAITYARQRNLLSTFNREGYMRNSLAKKRAIGQPSFNRGHPSPEEVRSPPAPFIPPQAQNGQQIKERALRVLDEAEALATKATLEPGSVTLDELANKIALASCAVNFAFGKD